jgi:hypothetical protein
LSKNLKIKYRYLPKIKRVVSPTNLRERAAADATRHLTREWGLPVELIDPEGVTYNTVAGSSEILKGQVLYNTTVINPDTGQDVIVSNPRVAIPITHLERVPKNGEKWVVRIPIEPSTTAELKNFVIDYDRSNSGGQALNFIRLYLRESEDYNEV